MRLLRRTAVLITLAAALLVAAPASAHRPEAGLDLGVTPIESSTTSYAFYRELTGPGDVHFYSFEGDGGQFFHAGINIPQIDRLAEYRVSLALAGPGLPPVDLAALPFDDGRASGVFTVSSNDNPIEAGLRSGELGGLIAPSEVGEDFFEPFTQTNYWGRQAIDLTLPETGTYYLVVWNPDGQPGKYVLDTGTEEVFGPGDLLRFPKWWVDTHVYFEHTPYLVGGAGAFLLGLAGIVVLRRKADQA